MNVRSLARLPAVLVCAAALVGGCATTKVLSTWKDPTVSSLSFRKILVIAPSTNPSLRRNAEDAIASRIRRAEAVPSYTLIPDAEVGNNELIRERAIAAGFDGIIVARVVSVDRQATWVPGMWTGPYYAYGGWGAYDPGYMRIDTFVRVETNIYSLPDDKLVWASASRTENPSSVRKLVDDTADAISKEMEKQGLIPPA
jgi:hypothetical protein